MTLADTSLIAAVGIAHLAVLAALWAFGLLRRFPWLAAHLATEGVCQLADVILGPYPCRNAVWLWLQIPRLALRAAVAREVWVWSTRAMPVAERRGLGLICGLFVVLAGLVAIFVLLVSPDASAAHVTTFQQLMLMRQYALLALFAWLAFMSAYVSWHRVEFDHNLLIYQCFATANAGIILTASSFVRGGLGYHFLPWVAASWSLVHTWQCIYLLLLLAICSLFVQPERRAEH